MYLSWILSLQQEALMSVRWKASNASFWHHIIMMYRMEHKITSIPLSAASKFISFEKK